MWRKKHAKNIFEFNILLERGLLSCLKQRNCTLQSQVITFWKYRNGMWVIVIATLQLLSWTIYTCAIRHVYTSTVTFVLLDSTLLTLNMFEPLWPPFLPRPPASRPPLCNLDMANWKLSSRKLSWEISILARLSSTASHKQTTKNQRMYSSVTASVAAYYHAM